MTVRIATVTGPSGVGKTTIVKKIMELKPDSKLITSLTTRDPRSSDLPGEYRSKVAPEEFEEKERFLWVVRAHGNVYGTLKSSVDEALASNAAHFMLLVPEAVKTLIEYAGSAGGDGVMSFYILSPSGEELRRRMRLRGESREIAEKRIADCKNWDEEARKSGIPYVFVSNGEPLVGIEKAAKEILKYLNANS